MKKLIRLMFVLLLLFAVACSSDSSSSGSSDITEKAVMNIVLDATEIAAISAIPHGLDYFINEKTVIVNDGNDRYVYENIAGVWTKNTTIGNTELAPFSTDVIVATRGTFSGIYEYKTEGWVRNNISGSLGFMPLYNRIIAFDTVGSMANLKIYKRTTGGFVPEYSIDTAADLSNFRITETTLIFKIQDNKYSAVSYNGDRYSETHSNYHNIRTSNGVDNVFVVQKSSSDEEMFCRYHNGQFHQIAPLGTLVFDNDTEYTYVRENTILIDKDLYTYNGSNWNIELLQQFKYINENTLLANSSSLYVFEDDSWVPHLTIDGTNNGTIESFGENMIIIPNTATSKDELYEYKNNQWVKKFDEVHATKYYNEYTHALLSSMDGTTATVYHYYKNELVKMGEIEDVTNLHVGSNYIAIISDLGHVYYVPNPGTSAIGD